MIAIKMLIEIANRIQADLHPFDSATLMAHVLFSVSTTRNVHLIRGYLVCSSSKIWVTSNDITFIKRQSCIWFSLLFSASGKYLSYLRIWSIMWIKTILHWLCQSILLNPVFWYLFKAVPPMGIFYYFMNSTGAGKNSSKPAPCLYKTE